MARLSGARFGGTCAPGSRRFAVIQWKRFARLEALTSAMRAGSARRPGGAPARTAASISSARVAGILEQPRGGGADQLRDPRSSGGIASEWWAVRPSTAAIILGTIVLALCPRDAQRFAHARSPRALRRPHRRRRPLRHRRRLPPADASAPARPTRSSRRATRIGGTWDLFRYPGIRSDSDMFTLGYRSSRGRTRRRSPTGRRSCATSARPRASTASTSTSASATASCAPSGRRRRRRWTVAGRARRTGRAGRADLRLPLLRAAATTATTRATRREFAGSERFGGTVVHPQHWPEDLDYAGKRVVVIGSGATAVTLVPAMAERAAHVTMLQRSPTYIVSLPRRDRLADGLRRRLPPKARLRARRAGRTSLRHARSATG